MKESELTLIDLIYMGFSSYVLPFLIIYLAIQDIYIYYYYLVAYCSAPAVLNLFHIYLTRDIIKKRKLEKHLKIVMVLIALSYLFVIGLLELIKQGPPVGY